MEFASDVYYTLCPICGCYKVSEGDLAKADHLLLQFCQKFAELYGLLMTIIIITSNKNIHFELILDVGIGEKRKETRF